MKMVSIPNDVPTLLIRRRSAEERADWTMARIYTEALAEMGAFGKTARDEQAAALKAAADVARLDLARRKRFLKTGPEGSRHGKLSEEDRDEMFVLRRKGATLAEIARAFSVSEQTASVVLRGVPRGRPTGRKMRGQR